VWGIYEVIDQWEWIPVLFKDPVDSPKIAAEVEGPVLLPYEEDWCSMRGA